jgi:hypothetical protein
MYKSEKLVTKQINNTHYDICFPAKYIYCVYTPMSCKHWLFLIYTQNGKNISVTLTLKGKLHK